MNPRPVIAISRAVVALLAVPVVFGAGLVSAPQVHATTPAPISVSLAVEDAVRFDGCTILPVEYSFDSSRYTDWKARVSIFPEFGTTPTKTKFLSASVDESSDFSEFFICDDEATGLWRVSMYVQLYIDDDTAEEGRGSADASFHFARAADPDLLHP